MHDVAVEAADRLELGALRKLERLYLAAISPLMEKHKGTFATLEKLEKDGAYGRARVFLRKSGIVDDIAKALAAAGVKAADLIREEIRGVKEVAHEQEETGATR